MAEIKGLFDLKSLSSQDMENEQSGKGARLIPTLAEGFSHAMQGQRCI